MILNNKLEMMWKKAVTAYFKVLSSHFPKETEEKHEKSQVRMAGLQAEICTWDLQNMKLE
jgi:hypothetical protein